MRIKYYGLIVLLLLLSACGGGAPRPLDTFVIGIENSPNNLDPRLAADAYASKLAGLIHAGLFRVDQNLQLTPHLLKSFVQVSPTEFRFELRPGTKFHDGTPLTAQDVAWTFNSIRFKQVVSAHFATFSKIQDIKVEDAQRFTIILKEPFAPFLNALTMGIIPQRLAATHDDKLPMIGAGPFKLAAFVPDEKVVLERFEDYFQGIAKPKQLIFKIIKDDNLRLLDLVKGRIDLLQNNVPAALIPYARSHPDIMVRSVPGINYAYMGFNLEDPYLSKLSVRQAIAHAIDREQVMAYKLNNMARLATGILAPMHWAYHLPEAKYPYDPSRAKQLLDEAGFTDPDGPGPKSRFKLYYKTSSKRDRIGMARLLAHYLQEVGIEVVVTPYEWGTLFRDIRQGNFQLYTLTWVGVTEPDIYYYTFHSSQIPPEGANRNRFRNSMMDQLTAGGRVTLDRGERKTIYREVQKIAAEELPYISLWYEDTVVVRRRDVKGYRAFPNASFWGLVGIERQDKVKPTSRPAGSP